MSNARAARAAILSVLPSLILLTAAPSVEATVTVQDLGPLTGFQGYYLGHLGRNRACAAADFNNDGRPDFYFGNPGDEAIVIANGVGPGGMPRFELAQVLVEGELTWGGVAADYDNDGDRDMFVTVGGNEGIGHDYLFQNQWMETGVLSFVDVTDEAGVAGPPSPNGSGPLPTASAHAVWGDYDSDGWVDLFVNTNQVPTTLPSLSGRNTLWHNNGDGTFTDVTDLVGLGTTRMRTRHSSWLDADNDGDLDLFENNMTGINVLWENQLAESGLAKFRVATSEYSPPGENLAVPFESFVSTVADFNNDGWQDILVFMRTNGDCNQIGALECQSDSCNPFDPYGEGHALFMNIGLSGTPGFVNVTRDVGLADMPLSHGRGVMGAQVADLNADGIPDIFVGNGGPPSGQFDQLYFSTGVRTIRHPDYGELVIPQYRNRSRLINFRAPEDPTLDIQYPGFPYRTHGTCAVDVDGDGLLELGVTNGGPSFFGDNMREPNRLFRFRLSPEPSWSRVRLKGDGVTVARDAIGSRVSLTVRGLDGSRRTLHRTVLGGNGFSAQNGYDLFFGLADAVEIESIKIRWADGFIETLTEEFPLNDTILVPRAP